MILFYDDWKRYPGAIAHLSTKNRTWVEICKLYRHMGIKNHIFPLALHDKTLEHVDPFDPNISMENQSGSGEDAAMLQANRGNIALYWCFFNHIMVFLIQIRQTGKSISLDELATYLLNVRCRNTDINLLTKDDQLRARNIKRLKDIDVELPFYLRQRTKADANNMEAITIKSLGNTFTTHVPQASPKAADKVGRGLTSPIFFIDEAPFQNNVQISVPAALAAGNDARARAARNGEPYGTIFTTTAGKKDTKEGAYIYRLKNESAQWTEMFFDCENQEDLEQVVRRASRPMRGNKSGGVYRVDITLNHRQLGKTDDWLAKTIESTAVDDELQVDRDYFNRWTAGSLTSPLAVEVMEKIRAGECEPEYIQISKQGYVTNWYIKENEIEDRMRNGTYIMAMDTSEASGGDDISMRISDIRDGSLIAVGSYNETNIITFSEWTAEWFIRYPNLKGIIERRSTGSAVIDQLLLLLPAHGVDPFTTLFNRVVNDADEHPDRFRAIQVPMGRRSQELYVQMKKHFGFATSATGVTSRTELYSSTLQHLAKTVGPVIKDKLTIDQMLSLVIRNGRVDHPPGEHDDACFIAGTLVRTPNGNVPIETLKVGDLVLTRKGYKPIIKTFCNEKEVISRYGLTGTPNHPFITPEGEIEFQHLKDDTKVYIWNEKALSIEEKCIIDTQNQKDLISETITGITANGKNLLLPYISKFISIFMDLYQKVCKYITKMEIFSIIAQKILNVFQLKSMLGTIQYQKNNENCVEKEENEKTNSVNGDKSILKKLRNFGKEMLNTLRKLKKLQWLPERKEKELRKKPEDKRLSSKTETHGLKDLINGEERIQNYVDSTLVLQEKKQQPLDLKRKEKVYNLMVADCHEYFVNDILVHNCIAALLSHWWTTKGKNLAYYGIDASEVLADSKQRSIVESVGLYEYNRQAQLSDKFNQIIEQIKNESDPLIIQKLSQEAKFLDSRIDRKDAETVTVDELISKAQQIQKTRKYNNASNISIGYNPYSRYGTYMPTVIEDPTRGSYY